MSSRRSGVDPPLLSSDDPGTLEGSTTRAAKRAVVVAEVRRAKVEADRECFPVTYCAP